MENNKKRNDMTSAAKSKGNSWERELSDVMKSYFGGHWMRVPNSGAGVGGSNFTRKEHLDTIQIRLMKGDIIPAEHMKHLVLEAKFYKEFPFHMLVREEVKILDTWIAQTIQSADKNDIWLLCIKINRKSSYVVFDKSLLNILKVANYTVYKDYIFTDLTYFLENNIEKIQELTK